MSINPKENLNQTKCSTLKVKHSRNGCLTSGHANINIKHILPTYLRMLVIAEFFGAFDIQYFEGNFYSLENL